MTTLQRSPTAGQSYASSSHVDALPPLPTLLTWVHRPQAVAKCFVSDVLRMASLGTASEGARNLSRDVFLLNRFPCRMVELVGWVAGVDHKEAAMVITLDDGDGYRVLPVTIRLSLSKSKPVTKVIEPSTHVAASHFSTAKERKAQRRAATAIQNAMEAVKKAAMAEVYARKDVRVGDIVRVIGRVDEWMRRKADGSGEWVRQVVVDEGTGGSVDVVDPDEQYTFAAVVLGLHEELYSRPFTIPPLPSASRGGPSLPSSPIKPSVWSDATEASSEAVSELSMCGPELKLCDPSKLRSSQLTDVTFRQYLLDYMNQETISAVRQAGATLSSSLETMFPEYKASTTSQTAKAPLSSTSRHNTVLDPELDPDATPTTFRSRKTHRPAPTPLVDIEPFTITHLLGIPHLQNLASLVVESEARREERRRRRRIRDGVARPRDRDIEEERTRAGRSADEWRLSDHERRSKMERLVAWVIRGVAEEGGLVQLKLPLADHVGFFDPMSTQDRASRSIKAQHEEFGYLPLPPPLLFPLIVPHIKHEHSLRASTIMRRSDPRYGNGMTLQEALSRLRAWGVDGRWERVGEWIVREALEWGEEMGELRRVGTGWWTCDGR